MAGVEQAGQDPDHRPGNARRDVADRRELRRAGKDEDTHRHHVDRGEAGVGPGREAVDKPETDAADHDPDAVEGESAAGAADGDVFAVVHPRTVALYRTRPDGTPRNVWEGRAVDLDLEGDRVRVRLSGLPSIVAEVTPAAVRELGLDRGDQVWVAVKATEVNVYPA